MATVLLRGRTWDTERQREMAKVERRLADRRREGERQRDRDIGPGGAEGGFYTDPHLTRAMHLCCMCGENVRGQQHTVHHPERDYLPGDQHVTLR